MQPDFILQYPDKRKVIIDSKVSLSAYERYNSSEEDMEQKVALQNHIAAIYNHVDELNKRNYSQFVKGLDFVMMFVPIEPAYLLAIQKMLTCGIMHIKRVILISPTNLIAAIKLISEIWKKKNKIKMLLLLQKEVPPCMINLSALWKI